MLSKEEAKKRLATTAEGFATRLNALSDRLGSAASEDEVKALEKEVESLRQEGRKALEALGDSIRKLPEFSETMSAWSNRCDGIDSEFPKRRKALEDAWAPVLPTEEDGKKAETDPAWRRIVESERLFADEAIPIRKAFLSLRDEARTAESAEGLRNRFNDLVHDWEDSRKKAMGVDGLVNRPTYESVRDELQRVFYAAQDAVDDCELRQRDRNGL